MNDFDKGLDLTRLKDEKYVSAWFNWQIQDMDEEELSKIFECDSLEEIPLKDPSGYRVITSSFKLPSEGEGENVYCIFAIAKEDVVESQHYNGSLIKDAVAYFKVRGYFNSYEGTSWNTETVTLLEPKIESYISFEYL